MKTLQTKAAVMDRAMLRRVIAGLALCVALSFLALVQSGSAGAQSGPMCDRFGPGAAGLAGWGACPAAPNITVTTSNSGSIGGASDYYLLLTDLSGASAACSTNEKYLGDWVKKMGGCGQFCFDFKVFNSGSPPGPITPSFTIWSGTSHATFVANFTVTANDPWRQHICAPVNLSATPPSGPQGHWVTTGNWNSIITNVTMIQLPIDFTSQPSEVAGYDNLCMNPQACPPPPPVIDGCLKDSKVTVTCNPDGTYTLTLSGSGFTGTTITLTSQTAGVTVTPPQQPWAATTTWTITGATPGQTVVLTANATNAGGGTEPGTDQCCSGQITIVMPDCPKQVGEVIVEKKVKNDTRASASVINSLVFPIGLSCTAPSNLNVSFGLNNGGTHTENNVPYTSVCTVTESVSTLPAVPQDVCGEGSTAVWLPPVISVTPSATIGAPVTTFTVVNELKCEKVGSLIVTKQVIYDGPIALPSQIYPVTVTCDGTITQLNLVNGVPQTVGNIPLPGSCSVVEGPVPTPPNICPPRTTPMWTTVYVPPSPIPITGLGATELVKNTLICSPVHTNTCPPPQVQNAAGACVCPPPLVPTLGAICGCPPGTVLRGKECVRSIKCDPPLIPNAAGTACVCPEGMIRQGRRCIAPPKCDPPKILGPDGKTCRCPEGMTQQGGRCVTVPKCRPPKVPSPDGQGCTCPTGMTPKGDTCVRQVTCQPPMILVQGPAGPHCGCPPGTEQRGNTCVRSGGKPPGEPGPGTHEPGPGPRQPGVR